LNRLSQQLTSCFQQLSENHSEKSNRMVSKGQYLIYGILINLPVSKKRSPSVEMTPDISSFMLNQHCLQLLRLFTLGQPCVENRLRMSSLKIAIECDSLFNLLKKKSKNARGGENRIERCCPDSV
jgi:hypothetical protein